MHQLAAATASSSIAAVDHRELSERIVGVDSLLQAAPARVCHTVICS